MKNKSIILFMLMFGGIAYAQNFEDDFTDQDISDWSGDIADFGFFTENENTLLQLQAEDAGMSQLSIPSGNATGYWEFFLRMDGFGPSGQNSAEFYLMSDSADFNRQINGYKLRIGESGGDDVFRLFRITGGQEEAEVLTGTTIAGSGGDYRIKVTRDGSGNWTLEVAEGYNGTLSADAAGTDNTYQSTNFFGFKLTYTSTRSDLFYLDFKIDPLPVIIDPLVISGFNVFSDTELDVTFSRNIDFSTVSVSDFELESGTNPESFINQSSNALRIIFNEAFPRGRNELTVSGIESDVNDTTLTDTTLSFVIFDEYTPGDIVINEFLKDPPSGSGLPEYVELKNRTSKYLNLRDWQIGDNNSVVTISATDSPVLPDSFLVISPDPEALVNTFGKGEYTDVSLPALNNTMDQIRLYDATGNIADSLEYTPDWGGNDVALERISTEISSTLRANWANSPQEIGTPGRKNDVEPDNDPPEVTDTFLFNAGNLRLIFSETLKEPFASEAGNYSVSGGLSVIGVRVSVAADTVDLMLSASLSDGQRIEITIRNQRDIFENILSDTTISLTYVEISQPSVNDVVINEILYRRADELSPEFVELFNNSDQNFDLSHWVLLDAAGNDAELPAGTLFPAGEYLVLTDRPDFAESLEQAIYLSSFPSLNDSGDGVIIKNSQGKTIDSLFYEDTWGGDIPGFSLERVDPGRASNDASNWVTSTAESGFSAGSQNSEFEEDTTPPEVIFSALLQQDQTEVIFSEFIRLTPATRFYVAGQEVPVLEFDSLNAHRVLLPGPPIEAEAKASLQAVLEVKAENLEDVKGNLTENESLPIALRLLGSPVVINEIMYDPLADPDDNLPDQTEYIELYNPSGAAVSLEGIFIHDAPDEEGEVRSIEPVSSRYKWIQPEGYFLIYAEDESDNFEGSKIAEYFGLAEMTDQFTIRVDRSSLSLASSGDAVFLSDSTGQRIDSVFYEESWQNPNVFDTDGISLEKIDPSGPGNESSNWSSSTDVSGGTPNAENSIYQEAGSTPPGIGILFSTNPFSPDDDGFEDNLFINYSLDHPDYLLRVRIFDRYGREVRELANGYQAGFNGSLIWDGLTDDRRKNRVGIYIVLFEAYDSAAGRDRTFKETVVLARRF